MHFLQYISPISSCIFKILKSKFSFLKIVLYVLYIILFSVFHLCRSLFVINLTLYITYCWLCDRLFMFLYVFMLMAVLQNWKGLLVKEHLQGTMDHLTSK